MDYRPLISRDLKAITKDLHERLTYYDMGARLRKHGFRLKTKNQNGSRIIDPEDWWHVTKSMNGAAGPYVDVLVTDDEKIGLIIGQRSDYTISQLYDAAKLLVPEDDRNVAFALQWEGPAGIDDRIQCAEFDLDPALSVRDNVDAKMHIIESGLEDIRKTVPNAPDFPWLGSTDDLLADPDTAIVYSDASLSVILTQKRMESFLGNVDIDFNSSFEEYCGAIEYLMRGYDAILRIEKRLYPR